MKVTKRATRGITKWRQKAIFADLAKTKITVYSDRKDTSKYRNVPKTFLEKPLPKNHSEKVTGRKPSVTELVSVAAAMLCFVAFVYFKMLQLEIQGQQAAAQIETLSTISALIGIMFLITFATSTIFSRFFPSES